MDGEWRGGVPLSTELRPHLDVFEEENLDEVFNY